MNGGPFVPEQVRGFERELQRDPQLVERVLQTLPPVAAEPERVIRASSENVDRAIARALAQAVVNAQPWRIEIANL